LIGIELSNTCISLVRQNHTDDCPSYKNLLQFDTSNQTISGRFIDTKGFFHRGIAELAAHFLLYKSAIMVDPDHQSVIYGKLIIIVPQGFIYIGTNSSNTINGTRTIYHDRFVNSDCTTATIDYSPFLLNDTISYLKSGCTITHFTNAKKITLSDYSAIDYRSSAIYKYMTWLKQAKADSKGNCITHKCVKIKDVNSKW